MNLPRAAQNWVPGFLADRLRRRLPGRHPRPRRLHVAITDHYEPLGGKVSFATARDRVATWQRLWPELAHAAPRDAAGQTPQYSFFYPQEEYDPSLLSAIAEICRTGTGDVEVHLHHDHETAPAFREKIHTFCRQLTEVHGLLRQRAGQTVFGFIHGNWALDNARPDGRWCGLPGEIHLLRELGCYADFTMPSAPSPTQGGPVNQIYWAGTPTAHPPFRSKSFKRGILARSGRGRQGELLMIPGPLGLRFSGRRLVPRLEMGELAAYDPPDPERIPLWLSLAPQLGEDIFLKLYTHGAREDNAAALLGSPTAPGLLPTFRALAEYALRHALELHWATAWQMFEAAERILSPHAPLVPVKAPVPFATVSLHPPDSLAAYEPASSLRSQEDVPR